MRHDSSTFLPCSMLKSCVLRVSDLAVPREQAGGAVSDAGLTTKKELYFAL